jgi:hypothetical protein
MIFIAEPDQWHLNVNPAIQNSDGYDFHALEIILYSVQLLPVRWGRGGRSGRCNRCVLTPYFRAGYGRKNRILELSRNHVRN